MLSLRGLTCATTPFSSSRSLSSESYSTLPTVFSLSIFIKSSSRCYSLRLRESSPMEVVPPMTEILKALTEEDNSEESLSLDNENRKEEEEEEDEEEEEEEKWISKIQVDREKYIPVSKGELLDAIVLKLFDSRVDAHQFLVLSSCLDNILHAEHKRILEEMRRDYSLIQSMDDEEHSDNSEVKAKDEDKNLDSNGDVVNGIGNFKNYEDRESLFHFNYGLDLKNLLESSLKFDDTRSASKSRLAVATRFQRAFMQLLNNAQFQELSATDLSLASALNSDYLLTLPIYVDWKKASESNAIIFRRGYSTERQKGLLIVEKLDYLQSRLYQRIFFLISKPLGNLGKRIKEIIRNASETEEVKGWTKRMTPWLEEIALLQQSYFNTEKDSGNPPGIDELSDGDLPIWLAAQRAVSRYEGFLSPVGPRGRLFRRFLARMGLAPPVPETSFELPRDNNHSEPHLRPSVLSRISVSDIWRPATRKYCGNDIWKIVKTSFSILLSRSVLQEPTFQELILLYADKKSAVNAEDNAEDQSLQLKIYEKIPIPDLPVVFPHKKLSFRIIDTVRLDAATILGLSAYFINYKFENILSSPSAIFLDVIAVTALVIYVTRVALGYKQTWDRYQLLVNKTLYEKTLASGFGSVHFLLDASEQQQYKEAILTYAILLIAKSGQISCHQSAGDECERFIYNNFKVKVEMPIDKALKTLVRLGLVEETLVDGRVKLRAIPCEEAYEVLKERWNNLIG